MSPPSPSMRVACLPSSLTFKAISIVSIMDHFLDQMTPLGITMAPPHHHDLSLHLSIKSRPLCPPTSAGEDLLGRHQDAEGRLMSSKGASYLSLLRQSRSHNASSTPQHPPRQSRQTPASLAARTAVASWLSLRTLPTKSFGPTFGAAAALPLIEEEEDLRNTFMDQRDRQQRVPAFAGKERVRIELLVGQRT